MGFERGHGPGLPPKAAYPWLRASVLDRAPGGRVERSSRACRRGTEPSVKSCSRGCPRGDERGLGSRRLPMRSGFAALLGVLFGVEYLLVRVGVLWQRLLDIGLAAARFVWEFLIWYWTAVTPDWTPLVDNTLELWNDMGVLITRTVRWLSDLLAGGTIYDVVGMALVWGLAVWLVSLWAGYVVRRTRRPLLGVLPGGIVLSFVLSYTGKSPYILLPLPRWDPGLMGMMSQGDREGHGHGVAWTTRKGCGAM